MRPLRGSLLVSVIAGALAAGCAHDLPGWKVAGTPHFRLYTDQSPRKFEWVLDRLEMVHAGLAASLFSNNTIPETEVFLFSQDEFHDLLGPVGGVALGNVGKQGVLVVYDGWEPAFIERTAAHELAHAFIGATFNRPPVWFNEGLATYAESVIVHEDAVLLGSNKVHVAGNAYVRRLVPVQELFLAPATTFHGAWERGHYTTAWAIIHYIWHGEQKRLRPRFDAFGAALSREAGKPGGSVRAWASVFPEVPLADVDGRLRDHMGEVFDRARDSLVGFRFKRPERPPTRLEPAEMKYVDQVRGQLRAHRRKERW
jgi:hypothetical protein